jgi:hypothetical protein
MIMAPGQMTRQAAPMRAVDQFPTARQAKDLVPATALKGAPIRLTGETRSSHPDDRRAPRGRLKWAQQAAPWDVLLPFALRVPHHGADRDAPPPPVRQQQQQRVPEDERLVLVEPRLVRQRLRRAGLAPNGRVGDQIERAGGRGRPRGQPRLGHLGQQVGGVPVASAQQTQHAPLMQARRHPTPELRERSRALAEQQRD